MAPEEDMEFPCRRFSSSFNRYNRGPIQASEVGNHGTVVPRGINVPTVRFFRQTFCQPVCHKGTPPWGGLAAEKAEGATQVPG